MPHGGNREAPHRVGRVVVYQGWRFGQEPRAARAVAGAVGRSRCPDAAVRAENPVHRSDQQSCTSRRPAVMITDHVPAVRIPPDHAGGRMAAAVAAGGGVADRRYLDPAPPARRTATAAAAPPERELGVPGPLAALLGVIPKARRHGLRLLAPPHPILRGPRAIARRRGPARSIRGKIARPPTRRNIPALVLRLARENPEW